jgi:hypothetical protein
MARRWTPEEDERLRRLYTAGASLAAMARDLGRSQDAVGARRAAVGLHSRRASRAWSALEDAIVTAANQAGLPATTVARQLRRAAQQVRARQRQLGLAGPRARRYAADEDALMRARWTPGADVDALARELGRSPDALRLHARQLGLHRPAPRRRWQVHEDAIVRDGYTDGLTCQEIAGALPARTATAIATRARKLGLVSYARRWTYQDDTRLRHIVALRSVDETAEALGRTPEAIRRRARKLGLTTIPAPQGQRAGKRWTPVEDERLRLHAALNPAVLARLLGRSDHAIAARLRQLDLRAGRQRSPHHPIGTARGVTPGERAVAEHELRKRGARALIVLERRVERPVEALRAARARRTG